MSERFIDASDRFGEGYGTDAPEAEVSEEQTELNEQLSAFQAEFENEDNKKDFAELLERLNSIKDHKVMRAELTRLSNKLSGAIDTEQINDMVRNEVEDENLPLAA